MELCFMKQAALDTLKNGLPQIFDKYFTERDNSWLGDVCGGNPFVKFRDVPDFELVVPNETLTLGDVDFENCKILYTRLNFLTPRQAADERLWAGLCHGVFYDYVRRRNSYDTQKIPADVDNAVKYIKNRFFFNGSGVEPLMKNSLARCWWSGRVFYDESNRNHFAKLDLIGAKDLYTKVFSTLTRGFVANPKLFGGVVKFLDYCRQHGIEVNADKNLRPALKEVNKIGGAVILDCLTADEIADIMIAVVMPKKPVNGTRTV